MINNINFKQSSGIIKNIFQTQELQIWENYFKKWTKTGDHILNCHGIDKKNTTAEIWFQRNVFNKIKKAIGNSKMQSVFGMYAESVAPYHLHDDAYHIKKHNINGKSYISWLIPYKVDGNINRVNEASTIIFNEFNLQGQVKNKINVDIKKKYLMHCESDQIDKVSIDKIIHWEPGSIIWWDMEKIHCSGSFNNFSTKEMFVGHTFIPN